MVRHDLRKHDIRVTGAIMTFDEWWEEYWPTPTEPSVCDAVLKDVAQKVWDAATAAERERWCRVIEGKERNTPLRETAAEIRRTP